MINKISYYQGGGGVNEPTPGEKKYKSDPAIVVQPRFKEPFYRNYDLYTIPGMEDVGPGTGYHGLQNYKSVAEFLKARRERLQPRYKADDSWIQDNGERTKSPNIKARAELMNRIIKTAGDENDGANFDYGDGAYTAMSKGKKMKDITDALHKSPGAFFADDNDDNMMGPTEHGTSIYSWKNSPYQGTPGAKNKKKKDSNDIDFPIDEEVNRDGGMIYPSEETYHNPKLVGPEGGKGDLATFPGEVGTTDQSSYINSTQIAGEHSYVPLPDQEDRSGEALNFGRDYTDEIEFPGNLNENDLEELSQKYLNPAEESGIFGLPDGVDPEGHDADQTIQVEDPFTGTSDIGTQIDQDKWNI